MEESNHELVHLLTQQLATIFTPMMENNTNQIMQHNDQNYQVLARQMGRLVNILGAPEDPVLHPAAAEGGRAPILVRNVQQGNPLLVN